MVDPRGGAFTVGLGLVANAGRRCPTPPPTGSRPTARTLDLLDDGVALVAIAEQTALIRATDGGWREAGAGSVDRVAGRRRRAGLEGLPGWAAGLLDGDEVDDEDEVLVRADVAGWSPLLAVGEVRRDHQLATAADLHARDALRPARR